MDGKKAFGLSFTLTAATAILGLGGCDGPRGWTADGPTRVCTNNVGLRLPDAECFKPGYRGGGWYYISGGGYVPREGQSVSGGSRIPMFGESYRSAPVSRGGFGMSGSRFGGFHGFHIGG